MRIYFSGCEVPAHRSVLGAAGAKRYAFNVTALYARLPKKAEWNLDKVVAADVGVLLYCDPTDTDYDKYAGFIHEHGYRAQLIVVPPLVEISWEANLLPLLVPIWTGEPEHLEFLKDSDYQQFCVPDSLAQDTKLIAKARSFAHRWKMKTVLLSSNATAIEAGRWDAVVISSWLSVQRYGEFQVWDGRKVLRLDTVHKDAALLQNRGHIEALDTDFEAIKRWDKRAASVLAVRSWLQLETRQGGAIATISGRDLHPSEQGGVESGVDRTTDERPKAELLVRDTELLPGVQLVEFTEELQDGDGSKNLITHNKLVLDTSSNMRRCNNCKLSSVCPKYEPNHNCAFTIPVEIRSKDQLASTLNSVIEMQLQRVMFAYMSEQMEGVGLDPLVSLEFERLLKMVERIKNISDNRDVLRFEMTAKAEAGTMQQLFGSAAAEATKALPSGGLSAAGTDWMLGEIMDADEVE